MDLVVCISSLECLRWDISLWESKNAIIGLSAGSANIIMHQGTLCQRFTFLCSCVKRFNSLRQMIWIVEQARYVSPHRPINFPFSLWHLCLLLNFMTRDILSHFPTGRVIAHSRAADRKIPLLPTAASGLYAGRWHPPSHLSLQRCRLHRWIFPLLVPVTNHFAFSELFAASNFMTNHSLFASVRARCTDDTSLVPKMQLSTHLNFVVICGSRPSVSPRVT